MKLHLVLIAAAIIPGQSAIACQFDTDCQLGSQCFKQAGSLSGECIEGISPGNRNNREPGYSPLDFNDTYGNTCRFDTDCDPDSSCVKSSEVYGICKGNDSNL